MRSLHIKLVRCQLYRRFSRRIIRYFKNSFSCPDPWGKLIEILKAHPEAVYLDIGAFDGATVQRIQDECGNAIHAFEPTPDTFARLKARYSNDPQVTLWNLALSEHAGRVKFHVNANKQTNSLLPNDRGNEQYVGSETKNEGSVEVECQTLDDWVNKNLQPGQPVVVKCDVQGAEELVITGGKATLRDRCLAFYTEVQIEPMYQGQASFSEIHEILNKELGLALHEIYPCFKDSQGRALQTDAMWLKL